MKNCNWCDNLFETDISYQIYCSEPCRVSATKEKIALRYARTKRQRRLGKDRRCKQCSEKLSIYNDDPLCARCNVNPSDVAKALKQIRGLSNE
jgi:hypothetical protein